jgi:hypothetical protein
MVNMPSPPPAAAWKKFLQSATLLSSCSYAPSHEKSPNEPKVLGRPRRRTVLNGLSEPCQHIGFRRHMRIAERTQRPHVASPVEKQRTNPRSCCIVTIWSSTSLPARHGCRVQVCRKKLTSLLHRGDRCPPAAGVQPIKREEGARRHKRTAHSRLWRLDSGELRTLSGAAAVSRLCRRPGVQAFQIAAHLPA